MFIANSVYAKDINIIYSFGICNIQNSSLGGLDKDNTHILVLLEKKKS